jgi:hypothetical protein
VFHADCYNTEEYIPRGKITFRKCLSKDDNARAVILVERINKGKIATDVPRFISIDEFLVKRIEVPISR